MKVQPLLPIGILATALFVTAGCDSKDPKSATTSKPSGTTTASTSTTGDAKKDSTPAEAPPKPTLPDSALPEKLKSDGFHYYGLSNPNPVDLVMTQYPQKTVLTGSVAHRLVDVKDGVATYQEESTGELHDRLGNDSLELRSDGVYEVTSDVMPFKAPMLDVPASLSKGAKWKSVGNMESNGQSVTMNVSYESEGLQSVTIGGKTMEAMYIVGKGTISGAKGLENSTFTTKEWLVKDIGLVKNEYSLSPKTGTPSRFVLEWQPAKKG